MSEQIEKPKQPRPRFADALVQLTAGEPAPSECGAQPAGTVSCAGIRQILHKTTSFFRFIPIVQSRQGGCRMCEMKSLLAACQPNPLSTLVPPKNPEISTISGFFLCQKGETFYSFFASGGQWGGNGEIKYLKPCDLRVRKYGFFNMLVDYKDEYYFM